MDSEIVANIRELGKTVEDVGRMLQTKRKRWFTRSEIHDLAEALRKNAKALRTYEEMIPKK